MVTGLVATADEQARCAAYSVEPRSICMQTWSSSGFLLCRVNVFAWTGGGGEAPKLRQVGWPGGGGFQQFPWQFLNLVACFLLLSEAFWHCS